MGQPSKWFWAAETSPIDPDFDADWFGAHPGNLTRSYLAARRAIREAKLAFEREADGARRKVKKAFEKARLQQARKEAERERERREARKPRREPLPMFYEYDAHVRMLDAAARAWGRQVEMVRRQRYLAFRAQIGDGIMPYEEWREAGEPDEIRRH